ncbi:MAG: SHOCT domain-containing protein [Dehalococcoidales bacterium]|nr:SHOCT domain-containing protein [Dehalococcoidales bacterium]
MMWEDGMSWWWGFSLFFMLIFGTGFIVLIFWAIKKMGKGDDSTTRSGPLDITRERYAKGEISKEEFEQIKKDLS